MGRIPCGLAGMDYGTPTALPWGVHSHLVDERPTIYYMHFWADGPLPDVLRGLRAALDAAR